MTKTKIIYLTVVACLSIVVCTVTYAKRGCCSWHGGVASCDTHVGRLICRDGTYSPSCLCERSRESDDDNKNNGVQY